MVKQFIRSKLSSFGKYEDAVNYNILFGSHSVLSASLNIGLITVKYILKKLLKTFDKLNLEQKKKIIPNVEGFIRQLIVWRSYVRFIYIYHGEEMIQTNQFNHKNKINNSWFDGTTGIFPIDSLIKKVEKIAYAHHIERLMYLGNFALISQINPKEIYDWFMICFIDSYEWVMVPNVFGMGQSASAIMMTRIYFSSSNYILKMSNFKNDDTNWVKTWNAVYYNFIKEHKHLLESNYATAMQVKHYNKKTTTEKNEIELLANNYFKFIK